MLPYLTNDMSGVTHDMTGRLYVYAAINNGSPQDVDYSTGQYSRTLL